MRIKSTNATFSYGTKSQYSSFPLFPGFITISGQIDLIGISAKFRYQNKTSTKKEIETMKNSWAQQYIKPK